MALRRQIEEVRDAELMRQTADLKALQSGGIPISAKERLVELAKRNQTSEALFTSNLAPDDLGLLRRHGYRPLGLVSGSAMWHVGQAYAGKRDCEVRELSHAYDEATSLAVFRLKEELKILGAHGVVGVTLSMVRHEWSEKTIEVQVLGTAIAGQGQAPKRPFMCDLSVQEWFALRRAGYDPAGLVWGYCTWFLFTTATDELLRRSWNNVELEHFSYGLSNARHMAMRNLLEQAQEANANGVVGVTIDRKLNEVRLTGPDEDPAYEREHHNLVVSIIGTAIRVNDSAPRMVQPTVDILSLKDGRIKPVVLNAPDVELYD